MRGRHDPQRNTAWLLLEAASPILHTRTKGNCELLCPVELSLKLPVHSFSQRSSAAALRLLWRSYPTKLAHGLFVGGAHPTLPLTRSLTWRTAKSNGFENVVDDTFYLLWLLELLCHSRNKRWALREFDIMMQPCCLTVHRHAYCLWSNKQTTSFGRRGQLGRITSCSP